MGLRTAVDVVRIVLQCSREYIAFLAGLTRVQAAPRAISRLA